VSLVTKCVTGDFLQLTFNDVGRGGWGQKVLSKPSAESFAVGRRQKGGSLGANGIGIRVFHSRDYFVQLLNS
jgi:hypothetical protein